MFQLTELTHKLREIFQINRADLDFGIYRILNTRSQEIERYLSQTLPQKVKQALGDNQSEQIAGWQAELEQAQKQAQELGIDPNQSPKVQELQNKIEQAKKVVPITKQRFIAICSPFLAVITKRAILSANAVIKATLMPCRMLAKRCCSIGRIKTSITPNQARISATTVSHWQTVARYFSV